MAEDKRQEVRQLFTKFIIDNFLLKQGALPRIQEYYEKIKTDKKAYVVHLLGRWATKVY
jgi:hypothetical protein